MTDFTNCPVHPYKGYGGGNGAKLPIFHEGKLYMLKFDPPVQRKKEAKHMAVSESIGCRIFASLGIPAQATLLGTCRRKNGTAETVVACEDFEKDGWSLLEFQRLKNRCPDDPFGGQSTELSSILTAIDSQTMMDPRLLKAHFWQLFIGDALIGNFDRHNGNWGLLIRKESQEVRPAPVYDCGSSLYPQLPEAQMPAVMASEEEIAARVYTFPTSAIKVNGKKLSYFDFIASRQNPDCTAALLTLLPRIDLTAIDTIIDDTPIGEISKTFYKLMIRRRKELILDAAYVKCRQ